jgi:hypothetical protein
MVIPKNTAFLDVIFIVWYKFTDILGEAAVSVTTQKGKGSRFY